jgi:hypothetical protein
MSSWKLRAAKIVSFVVLGLGLPALYLRFMQALHLPAFLRTFAITAIVLATIYDLYVIREVARSGPEAFTWKRITWQQLPRLLFTLVIALLIDLPIYTVYMRQIAMQYIVYAVTNSDKPGAFHDQQVALISQRLHYTMDPLSPWAIREWEDPTRSAFLKDYEFMSPTLGLRTKADCDTFFQRAKSTSLAKYPALNLEFSKSYAVCFDRVGQYSQSAAAFTEEEARYSQQMPVLYRHNAFNAIMEAQRDKAHPQTIRILQADLLAGSFEERSWLHNRCEAQYKPLAPQRQRFEGGRAGNDAWQLRWQQTMGPVCTALGVPTPAWILALTERQGQ